MTPQEAINNLKRAKCVPYKKETLTMAIKALEEKTGNWKVVCDGFGDSSYICECSECKDTIWVYKDADRKWNYCPNCGAKMAESEETNADSN